MIYRNPDKVPNIRQHTPQNPATCPWCGEEKWFVSMYDDSRDNGRVQMYCDNTYCDSRETELIIMRGEGAHDRADVRALRMIDDGHHAGDVPSPSEVNFADPREHQRRDHKSAQRIAWRQGRASFAVEPVEPEDEV